MSSYAVRKQGAKRAAAADRQLQRDAAAYREQIAADRRAAADAARVARESADAAAPCDVASLAVGDYVRDRWGWHRVTRCNATSVTASGTFGPERILHARVIETRKAGS